MTVAIAAFNAAAFLAAAVESALAQTLSDIEVIVVDDGSSDETVTIAHALAARDLRVCVSATPHNSGPAGARNVAMQMARGDWFAVLDSDDVFAPTRLARLVALGEAEHADIVADDLIVFHDDGSAPPRNFLSSPFPRDVDLATYLEHTVIYGRTPDLGFLKPVVRTNQLRATGIAYDERLRIAEDDHFIVQMLMAGFRYRIDPTPGYLYRKHGSSISHRLSVRDIVAMRDASTQHLTEIGECDRRTQQAFAARHRALLRAEAFARWVDATKARRFTTAAAILLRRPSAMPLLRMPIGAALRRLRRPSPALVTTSNDGLRDASGLAAKLSRSTMGGA